MHSPNRTTAFRKSGNRILIPVRDGRSPAVFPSHGAKPFSPATPSASVDAMTVTDAAAPTTTNVWGTHRWSILRWSSPVALLVLWQLLSAAGLIPGDVLPAPQLIFDAGWQLIQNGKLDRSSGGIGAACRRGPVTRWCRRGRPGHRGRALAVDRGHPRPAASDAACVAAPGVDSVVHSLVRHRRSGQSESRRARSCVPAVPQHLLRDPPSRPQTVGNC